MKRELALIDWLRSEGPQAPAAVMSRFDISQPTLFRAVKGQSEMIVSLGAKRNRQLAVLRSVRNLGSRIPIFCISETGAVSKFAELVSLFPDSFAFVLESDQYKPLIFPGLPYFLDDLRPQGFMGRAFLQNHKDLNLPNRVQDLSSDDTLVALSCRGEELPGNLLVGAESFERHQSAVQRSIQRSVDLVDWNRPEKNYVALAKMAIDGEMAGSSAGGEQPKFTAVLSRPENSKDNSKNRSKDNSTVSVLVKFSPAVDSFAAERWRDLLICESLALLVLRQNRIAAVESRLHEAGGRTFLETTRFDRVGQNGRIGTRSLSALENEWVGNSTMWASSVEVLERKKILSKEDLKTVRLLESFGRLIANTDRHSGNLSFFWDYGDKKARLAPVYDMLPMLFAPSQGGEDTRKKFLRPSYEHTLLEVWPIALRLAREFWTMACDDVKLSKSMRKIAADCLKCNRPDHTP